MSWFSRPTRRAHDDEGEEDIPYPPRSASDEYLEGLKFAATCYEARAKSASNYIVERANRIVEQAAAFRVVAEAAEIRDAAAGGLAAQKIADDIRGWIRGFEVFGYRPPHLPPLPVDPAKPESQGE